MTSSHPPSARRPVIAWLLPCLLALCVSTAAHAAPIAIAGTWKDGKLTELGARSGSLALAKLSVEVKGDVADGALRYQLRDASGDGIIIMPLPEQLMGDGIAVRRGWSAKDADGARPAEVVGWQLDAEKARPIWTELARATERTDLLAFIGRPAWFAPAVDLATHRRLSIDLRWRAEQRDGIHRLAVPLPINESDIQLRARATIVGESTLHAVMSPDTPTTVQAVDHRTAKARLTAHAPDQATWTLMWVDDAELLGLRTVLSRRGDDAYALVLLDPAAAEVRTVPKDVVLAIDTSGSMLGEKLEQARAAAAYIVDRLGPGDRFNIIAFGTSVKSLAAEPVPASPAQLERALGFLDERVAHGQTHVSGALAAATRRASVAGDGLRPHIVLFLTDGTPTVGERSPDAILDAVPARADGGPAIFVVGVGPDVNAHLLDRVAERTGGRSLYVDPDDALDVQVAALYDSLSRPALSNVRVSFNDSGGGKGIIADAIHPAELPMLFYGQRAMVVARIKGGAKARTPLTVQVDGTFDGRPIVAQRTIGHGRLAERDARDRFVAELWANRRLGALLRRIRLEGGDEATIAEVVELSRQFGIHTEFTAFLSTDETEYDAATANERAAAALDQARGHLSGQWAVRQADNEAQLQRKTAVGSAANRYRDRQGKVRAAAKVRTVNGRAFYKRGERWVEANDGKARKKRRVKKFSKDYFELVEQNRDFAEAQKLGGDTVFNTEDAQVEVY